MKKIAGFAFLFCAAMLVFSQNAESQKVDRVFSKMSERAQKELSFSDKDSFLLELNEILNEEKSFRKDDVSLFYLIDKKHNVGSSYVPKDLIPITSNALFDVNKKGLSLRPEAEVALRSMAKAAKADGIKLLVSSTYRSYQYQENLFNYWVRVDGLKEAERESARAGTSQHQLGVAVDFGTVDDSFAETKMGKWLFENAALYGWSLSFPKEYEDITGFRWECWHYRYIGEKACAFQKKYFKNVQQYMIEFIDLWKKENR